jgi:NAD(P)-dependent dehydrogenase (short-subunit alcohol dehydrogenase family)
MPDLSLFDLTGKKALVTGGAVGIGRACATALAMAGADVAVVDINAATAAKTVEDLRAMGSRSFLVACDVADKVQVDAMVGTVIKRFGRLDIAVNNAGIFIPGPDETQPKEDWDKVLAVNLTGVWLCAQAEARQMMAQAPAGGKIVNTASMAATIISDANGAYAASKAGVVHLTRTLAGYWGRFNINVNCFSPSYVMTPLEASTSDDLRQTIRDTTPMGHVERPEDLYGPIVFLASAASDYVTGHDLMVDGGHTLNTWLGPLERAVPARISPSEETVQMKRDLAALGATHAPDAV